MNEFSLHFVAFIGWMGVIDVLEDGTFNMWSFFLDSRIWEMIISMLDSVVIVLASVWIERH